jgi:hypothetical protein
MGNPNASLQGAIVALYDIGWCVARLTSSICDFELIRVHSLFGALAAMVVGAFKKKIKWTRTTDPTQCRGAPGSEEDLLDGCGHHVRWSAHAGVLVYRHANDCRAAYHWFALLPRTVLFH